MDMLTVRSHAFSSGQSCGAILTPKDLLHEALELFVGDAAWRRDSNLAKHVYKVFVGQVLALAAEALLQVLLSDETRVVDVEVMESKQHVRVGNRLSAVDGHRQELSVVDFAIVVKVDAFEQFIDLLLAHV